MADRHLIDVHVLLVGEGNILLTQRRDTNSAFDGLWHLPSGKLDAGESAIDAAAREAEEEVGVLIEPIDLRHVHTSHVNGSGPEPRLGLFFEARHWIGDPRHLTAGYGSASIPLSVFRSAETRGQANVSTESSCCRSASTGVPGGHGAEPTQVIDQPRGMHAVTQVERLVG